jgi:hypothetical protein
MARLQFGLATADSCVNMMDYRLETFYIEWDMTLADSKITMLMVLKDG